MSTIHAKNPVTGGRISLCQVTHECDDTPVKLAGPKDRVNCSDCRVVINFCQTFNRNYRSPESEDKK